MPFASEFQKVSCDEIASLTPVRSASSARGRRLNFALVMAMLYIATRSGMADRISIDVVQLLGRSPIVMRQYIQDYRDAWL